MPTLGVFELFIAQQWPFFYLLCATCSKVSCLPCYTPTHNTHYHDSVELPMNLGRHLGGPSGIQRYNNYSSSLATHTTSD